MKEYLALRPLTWCLHWNMIVQGTWLLRTGKWKIYDKFSQQCMTNDFCWWEERIPTISHWRYICVTVKEDYYRLPRRAHPSRAPLQSDIALIFSQNRRLLIVPFGWVSTLNKPEWKSLVCHKLKFESISFSPKIACYDRGYRASLWSDK